MNGSSRSNARARRTSRLSYGRVSLPDARYFLTLCAVRPSRALTEPEVAHAIADTLLAMQAEGDWLGACSTVMPDHLHLLGRLGARLSLGQIVGKLKALTKSLLTAHKTGWQANFFEHRLRPDEPWDCYAFYVFLNPYRTSLIDAHQAWPWWWRSSDVSFDFESMLRPDGTPPDEWVGWDAERMGLRPESVGSD